MVLRRFAGGTQEVLLMTFLRESQEAYWRFLGGSQLDVRFLRGSQFILRKFLRGSQWNIRGFDGGS